MKAMSKSELALAAGVTTDTLRNWLNDPYMQKQLEPFHLKKQQQILPPKAVQIITDHYAIEVN